MPDCWRGYAGPPKSFSGVGLTRGFLCSLTGMIGANLRAPNAITKNALSRLTSYEAITAALAELRNSLGFDSWNGLIALHVRPSSCSILTVIGSSAAQ